MTGWHSVNGWSAAARAAQRFPNLVPFDLLFRFEVVAGQGGEFGPGTQLVAEAIIEPDGDFYGIASSCVLTQTGTGVRAADGPNPGTMYVELEDEAGGLRFTSDLTFASHLFGQLSVDGLRHEPYWWPVPLRFRVGSRIRLRLRVWGEDVEGPQFFTIHGFKRLADGPPLAVDVFSDPRVVGMLARYRAAGRLVQAEPFTYSIRFDAVNGTRVARMQETRTIPVSDCDFLLLDVMGNVWDPDGADPVQIDPARVQTLVEFNEDTDRVRFMDRPVMWRNLMGTGRDPHRLAWPLLLRRGAVLTTILSGLPLGAAIESTFETCAAITYSGVRFFSHRRR